jgi:hypothetical protein
MKRLRTPIIIVLVLGVGLLLWYSFIAAGERVTFYQTYGYKEGDSWVIPIHLRVWERGLVERGQERLIARAAESAEQLTGQSIGGFDLARFRSRIGAFAADDESGQNVVIGFDKDPQDVRYPIASLTDGRETRSDRNGRIDGRIRIPLAAAAELMRSQASSSGLLTYHAVSSGHSGEGKVRLLEDDPTALSVISDIDDTIKITEVPAGHRVLYLNTFIREFHSAPGMADRYKQWGQAAFHYVSGGPWQLYEPYFEFLPDEGFPDGSVHMRNLPLLVTDPTKAREFIDFLFDKQATKRHKLQSIREIMARFPNRRFILVGDSGEADPEVYREIKADAKFGTRVEAILIRIVSVSEPGRLDGMVPIEADLVRTGVSQFDK